MPETRVAIITGGASGIGLATAIALGKRNDGWEIHALDYNPAAAKAVEDVNGGIFHQVDVTDYAALGTVFRDIFRRHRRLDFVYANAGIAEIPDEFFETSPAAPTSDEPPALPPNTRRCIDICLTAATTTAYLAQHYFRLSPASTRGNRALVFTASCGGIYACHSSPVYAAAKHAVVGLMRSLDTHMWRRDGIRSNAVLPGTVRTNLLTSTLWKQFPDDYFTPVSSIVEAVLIFVDGKDPKRKPDLAVMRGQAIECSGKDLFYRDQHPFADESMRIIMSATDTGE
ncbi:NAD(P)-binding domain protein [Niveomyces insectorum RCEF 264]|uniref:NAD(P)-binding domain protein n=1 Tax=Niveomyces insectorum RCEF 264 TaxID=1081102 RepID=A0A167T5I0_9HYPO|nr:NAD(P)-binding domain protein [Niveomyces insectorum RCEF 264]